MGSRSRGSDNEYSANGLFSQGQAPFRVAGAVCKVLSCARLPQNRSAMKLATILSLAGATIGGWAGWIIGAPISVMLAFVLGMIGTGFGMYFGTKLGRHWS